MTYFLFAEWLTPRILHPSWMFSSRQFGVLLTGRIMFKHFIPKEHMWYGWLLKEGDVATDMMARHRTQNSWQRRLKVISINCMDNFLSPDLFKCLIKKKISCYGTVGPNRKECHSALLAACFLLLPCFTWGSMPIWNIRLYNPHKLCLLALCLA
jgi:hypothetical protein